MKTAEPKIIYLQIGDDADIAEFKPEDFETNAITWCWERMFDNDIEYISKQSIIKMIDDMIEVYNARLPLGNVSIANVRITNALTELKQKIESL